MSLGQYEAAARLAIDGRSPEPFTIRTLPAAGTPDPALAEAIRAASAEQFGRLITDIDQELAAALGTAGDRPTAGAAPANPGRLRQR